ncbi:NitT/TauT family transport system substrate-binding protein [Hydrogenispora ethanolica]|uniref:NitT/TauT family transport system substrate-binding protein n=1 Tax=Hydrogenispora ethanolica TaxID=1082276 RepID=A0A4R1S573_HYDET|nr:aliphatic sulfonate ABC transporter substrate-binding protein [Hydrogenispora ethanolica]TCL74164.1 NitT/TauT family transport system substrate-binding protein [Hydrogenispora ethanolica]
MKKGFWVRLSLVMLVVLLVGSAVFAKPAKRISIRVAYHPHIVGAGTVLIAQEKGYFEDENLDVQLVQFTSGPPELAAMASGDIDIGYLGVGAHVFAAKGQCKILVMDSTDISNLIIATKKSKIRSLKDLYGKTVAVPKGTTADMIFGLACKKANLDVSKINVINMDVAGAVAAFVADRIDAAAIWEPFVSEIKRIKGKNNVVQLLHSKEFVPKAIFPQSWVATPKFLENNREATIRFMKAWIRANEYRYRHMDECVKITAKYLQQDETSTAVLVDGTKWLDTKTLKKMYNNGTALKWYEIEEQIFVDNKKLDQFVPATNFVDPQYFKEALKELKM